MKIHNTGRASANLPRTPALSRLTKTLNRDFAMHTHLKALQTAAWSTEPYHFVWNIISSQTYSRGWSEVHRTHTTVLAGRGSNHAPCPRVGSTSIVCLPLDPVLYTTVTPWAGWAANTWHAHWWSCDIFQHQPNSSRSRECNAQLLITGTKTSHSYYNKI